MRPSVCTVGSCPLGCGLFVRSISNQVSSCDYGNSASHHDRDAGYAYNGHCLTEPEAACGGSSSDFKTSYLALALFLWRGPFTLLVVLIHPHLYVLGGERRRGPTRSLSRPTRPAVPAPAQARGGRIRAASTPQARPSSPSASGRHQKLRLLREAVFEAGSIQPSGALPHR